MVQNHNNLDELSTRAQWAGSGDYSRDAIISITDTLGSPQDAVPSVLIGGTNGKGSTAAMLCSIAMAEGKKVGLCTSPHLSRVNERIRIGGSSISDDELDQCLGVVIEAEKTAGLKLSFFELVLAASFVAFKRERVDLAVIEVGLGGDRDATNIIASPEVSAVVSVDFDHEAVLGNTLKIIAYDKGGICRQGRPFVIGDVPAEALEALERRGREVGANSYVCSRDFTCRVAREGVGENCGVFTPFGGDEFQYCCGLRGEHQLSNAAVSMQIASFLGYSMESMKKGVREVSWPGRLESITSCEGLGFLVDCAHNIAGIRALKEHLLSAGLPEITVVIGLLETARWKEMIKELEPQVSNWIFLEPQSGRALEQEELESFAAERKLKFRYLGERYTEVLEILKELDTPDSKVLVTGSMYMVGPFRELLVGKDIVN